MENLFKKHLTSNIALYTTTCADLCADFSSPLVSQDVNPGSDLDSFSQAEIENGDVKFVHDMKEPGGVDFIQFDLTDEQGEQMVELGVFVSCVL